MILRESQSAETAALRRRSIRKYKPDPIPREDLLRVLELAGRAPSAWNLQPWRFVAVTAPDAKRELQAAAYNQPQVGAAAAVLVVYSDMKDTLARLDEVMPPTMPPEAREKTKAGIIGALGSLPTEAQEAWGRGQAYIALGYLLLLLESFGYGSSPMLGFQPQEVKRLYGLPGHVEIAALVALGIPDDAGRESHRRPVSDLVQWVSSE